MLIIKKSKFIPKVYEVKSEDEVLKIIKNLKKEHKKARHFCYAYKIGSLEKKNDDNEPRGTAGIPILNMIKLKNEDNILVVVIRYFGGIKLGSGPLLRAYHKAAGMGIDKKRTP